MEEQRKADDRAQYFTFVFSILVAEQGDYKLKALGTISVHPSGET